MFLSYELMTKLFHQNIITKTTMMNREIYYFMKTIIV